MEIIVASVSIYIIMIFVTYLFVESVIYSNIDISDPEDRELLDDRITVSICIFLVSCIWIIYLPYVFFNSRNRETNNT